MTPYPYVDQMYKCNYAKKHACRSRCIHVKPHTTDKCEYDGSKCGVFYNCRQVVLSSGKFGKCRCVKVTIRDH